MFQSLSHGDSNSAESGVRGVNVAAGGILSLLLEIMKNAVSVREAGSVEKCGPWEFCICSVGVEIENRSGLEAGD